jgi:hypothetical protein
MHRHLSQRAFAAFVLAWFVAIATELPLLHACQLHGPAATAAGEHHGAAANHDGLHAGAQQKPDAGHATCSCMGDCSAGGFSVGLSSPEHRLAVAPARDTHVVSLETDGPRLPAPPFFLPYANGPPGISVLA